MLRWEKATVAKPSFRRSTYVRYGRTRRRPAKQKCGAALDDEGSRFPGWELFSLARQSQGSQAPHVGRPRTQPQPIGARALLTAQGFSHAPASSLRTLPYPALSCPCCSTIFLRPLLTRLPTLSLSHRRPFSLEKYHQTTTSPRRFPRARAIRHIPRQTNDPGRGKEQQKWPTRHSPTRT